MQRMGDFRLPPFFNYPPYFTLQPVRETREKQVQLWKDLILDYCKSQKIHIISLEEDFPLFSNPKIERSLSFEAKEVLLAALVNEGRAEWMDKGHKKCLVLWLRIQDWANFILNFVRDNGLEVMTIEEIRYGIDTRGTELAGIDRGVLMRALRLLEQKGKAAIFKGTSAQWRTQGPATLGTRPGSTPTRLFTSIQVISKFVIWIGQILGKTQFVRARSVFSPGSLKSLGPPLLQLMMKA